MPDPPLISIITPTFNRGGFLAEAIESVLHQDYPHIEHIVVDGGSTDGTLEILARYPHLRVVSEPDEGLYDAINKGIRMARGDIIGHLNSDDLYAPHVFGEIARAFEEHPEADVVSGGAVVFEALPTGGRRAVATYAGPEALALSFRNITVGVPVINARFFRRRVYDNIGGYDTRYRIAADRDFLLRVALANVHHVVVDRIVYHYRRHDESLTITANAANTKKVFREHQDMIRGYLQMDGVSPELKHYCQRWLDDQTVNMGMLSLKQRRWGEALRYAWLGWRYNPLWPIVWFERLLLAAGRKFHGR